MKFKDLVPWKSHTGSLAGSSEFPFFPTHSNIDRIFSDFFNSNWAPMASGSEEFKGFSPKVNVKEHGEAIIVTAEVPGLQENDFDIEVSNDYLILKGEKKFEEEKKEGEYSYFESSFGSFQRTIPLGVEVDHDGVQAELSKGLLTITLPKAAPAKSEAKRISVKSS